MQIRHIFEIDFDLECDSLTRPIVRLRRKIAKFSPALFPTGVVQSKEHARGRSIKPSTTGSRFLSFPSSLELTLLFLCLIYPRSLSFARAVDVTIAWAAIFLLVSSQNALYLREIVERRLRVLRATSCPLVQR